MSSENDKEHSLVNSVTLFEHSNSTSSNTNTSVFILPTQYKIKKAEDTIKLAKVFAIQILYAIVFVLNAIDIVLNPWITRWFYWRNLLNQTGPIFIFLSIIVKLMMRHNMLDKIITKLLALLSDFYITKYIVTYIYYLFAWDAKIQQTYQGLFLFIYLGLFLTANATLLGVNLWIHKIKKRRVFLSLILLNITCYIFLWILKLTTKNLWPGSFNTFQPLFNFFPVNLYLVIQVFFVNEMLLEEIETHTLALSYSMQADIFFSFWKNLYLHLKVFRLKDIHIPGSSFGSF